MTTLLHRSTAVVVSHWRGEYVISLTLFSASFFIFALTYFSLNTDTRSDPRLTLLVAQSIIEHGTVQLDAYKQDVLLDMPFEDYVEKASLILQYKGHYYYYFPVGPSVLSVPFVWVTRLMGWDMLTADNWALQDLLAALSSVAIFLIIYRLGRAYIDTRASLLIAFISVTGSSLVSTLGTALWSLNFTTILFGLALLILVRYDHDRFDPVTPYLLGLLLFLAYFCRASAAVFILAVFFYLLWLRRLDVLLKTGLTALLFLVLFLLWSRYTFGEWLPVYYTIRRFQVERVPVWVGILGNLFSPSRGLFVFSPFFLLTAAGVGLYWRGMRRRPLFWFCLVWLGLQLWVAAQASSWWGGWAFGPRLMTDALVAPILITCFVWQELRLHGHPSAQRLAVMTYVVLGMLGIVIHGYQGLYSQPASRWNGLVTPLPQPPDEGWGDFFNWRYAQVFASNQMLCTIELDKLRAYRAHDTSVAPYHAEVVIHPLDDQVVQLTVAALPIETGATMTSLVTTPVLSPPVGQAFLPLITRQGNRAIFVGWLPPESHYRWTACPVARVWFRLAEFRPSADTYSLVVTAGSLGRQRAEFALNGVSIGEHTWDGPIEPPAMVVFPFVPDLLRPNDWNEIELYLPEARWPDWRTQIPVALSLAELRLAPGEVEPSLVEPPTQTPAYP